MNIYIRIFNIVSNQTMTAKKHACESYNVIKFQKRLVRSVIDDINCNKYDYCFLLESGIK